jgi:pyruvate/2-oxoglutarate/acetoin dehydrogenase E1 component
MGFGAEVVAETTEHMFGALKAPPMRLGAPRIPVPFSEPLEMLCRMTATKIVASAARVMDSGRAG